MEIFKIDFLSIRFVDFIDILLVAVLLYAVYKIIKGSIALNIFFGFLLLYGLYLFVKALDMNLLTTILGGFIEVGVIALLIVFQQEIRRFLLLLGRKRIWVTQNPILKNIVNFRQKTKKEASLVYQELAKAVKKLSTTRTGALIVLSRSSELRFYNNTGIPIDAIVSAKLIETIFNKTSPLHDGAIIIVDDRVVSASCILPVSENQSLPPEFGLRHRSALGISEQTDAMAIVVSEETGRISFISRGELSKDYSKTTELAEAIRDAYMSYS